MASLALLGTVNSGYAQQGASLNFDGTNDYVDLGNALSATLSNATNVSVEAWVYPTATTGVGAIVGNHSGSTQFQLRRNAANYDFFLGFGAFGVTSAATATVNTWQHVAGVFDGSNIHIYVNGQLSGTTPVTYTLPASASPVEIGDDGFAEYFAGNIDEVRVWSTARTQSEIQANMSCPVNEAATGLLALYGFNEAVAGGNNTAYTTLHDVTGHGNNGTLNGFTLTGTSSNYAADAKSDYLSLQSAIGSAANIDRLNGSVAGDFDNDGDQDILCSDDNFAGRIYLNSGRGNFPNTFVSVIPTGGGVYATGDLDGDGDLDFTCANGTAVVKAYINNGSGTFTPMNVTMNGTGTASVSKIADMNNDGKLDIIIGNNQTGATDKTEVWLNTGTTGSAAFTFAAGLANNSAKYSIATGDVDGDGDVDIITGSYTNGAELFLNNNNTGAFTQGSIPANYSKQVFLIDWDQDGDLDYLTYDNYNNAGLRLFPNDGAGNWGSGSTLLQSSTSGNCFFSDLNADGFLDAALDNFGGNGLVYLSNGCQLSAQVNCNYLLGAADNHLAIADFNGDGSKDIFCAARDRMSSFFMNFLTPVTGTPLPVINISGSTLVNYGASTVLTASGASTYAWSANAGSVTTASASVSPTVATTYTVVGTNTVGCSANATVLVSIKGAALDFDGTNDVVDLGTALTAAFNGGTQVTAEAWVYPTTTTGTGAIVGNHQGPTQFQLRRNGSNYDFMLGFGSFGVTSAATVTVNSWQHVAAVFDGSSITIYVNGVASGSTPVTSFSLPPSTVSMKIGGDGFGNEYFAGTIDEVRIWNRALCQGEIMNNMNGELKMPQTGLLGYYMLDQGVAGDNNATITSAADSSGNANTGSLNGFALNGTTSNWIAPGGVLTGNYATAYVAPTLTVSGTTTLCEGQSTVLTASGASTYTWTGGPSADTYTVSPTTNTSYSVAGTNSVGCASNLAVVTVTVNPAPVITSESGNVTVCDGSSGNFTVNSQGSGDTYQWYWLYTNAPGTLTADNGTYSEVNYNTNNMTINILDNATWGPSGAQAVTCIVTGLNGCTTQSAIDTIFINALPGITASVVSDTLCLGLSDTLNAAGGVTYVWSNNAGSATTASVVISPTVTDMYTVTGTDGNGCVNTATVSVVVENCGTGINEPGKGEWVVYPNPGNGNLTLRATAEIGLVEVYNALGVLVYKTYTQGTELHIDLSSEAAGIYYLHAQGRKTIISKQ